MPKLSLVDFANTSQRDTDHLRYVMSAIEVGLWPWKPGKCTAYVSDIYGFEYEPFRPIVTIENELLPRLPFSYQMDLMELDDHQNFAKMADEAFLFYRYRPALPVDEHIILGAD